MKLYRPTLSAATVSLITAALAISTLAQAPAPPPQAAGSPPPPPRAFPAPTNLKVLPKELTGEQVREIMEGWEAALGAKCSTCHTPDPNDIAPNGRPRLNFADDSMPEKNTARLMFRMTKDINEKYVSMVENSGAAVTCGTCHRGHLGPEPWVAPREEHERHEPPPGGEKPPIPR